ncbi:uncharacterized protein [Ptychodera flava]|uniref:uncharacterized protein n=1 Tax=Ptychodera flava TaxID=63121 RepID=UPI00396A142C
MTIWHNASISVYGTNVNVFFTSGYETNRFEVTLDDQGKPTYIETTHTRRRYMSIGYGSMDHDDCVDLRSPTSSECNIVAERPYIKACYPFITFKNIHDVITHFEKSPNGLDSVDASCLRYCLSVVGKNDAKTLKNARISVFGRYIRVVFLAGTQKRQIEISLDENYKPICQDVFADDADKEIKSLVDDAMSESTVNLEDFVSTERPYIKQCHPFISAKNISDMITFFEETVEGLDPVDRICLGKCFTLVEKYDIKTLSSALLSVFGKRMKVIFTAGGERNKFEVTLDENYTPICRKILVPNEISDDLEDRKHEEILEECSPRISFKHIHDVVLRLEASPREIPVGDMRCLKHCYKIVEEQEHGVLDNAVITVLGMIITVIFKSGIEVNEFEITLDDHGRPICHHTVNSRQTDESVADEELTSHQFENFGEIVEDCSPCISFNHIHSIVQRLESSGKEVHDGDMRCLKYCYTLMKEQEQEVLENAKLVVYGIYCTIIFKSGIELNVFEITLNDQNEPICREIRKVIERSRGRAKTKTVSSSIDNEETTKEVSCQPFITAKHINDAITELTSPSETKTLKDEACLRYCFTLLREKDASIWKNARISVYGVNLTIIFKSGMESHQFEVTLNDHHEPMHVETYNRQGERYSLVPYSNRDAIPSRRVFEDFISTRRPYVKQCHPSISAKNISDVIKLFEESQEGLDPVDRICLKHCFTVLEKYDSKTLCSALLSVFGKFVKVVFTAGSERNQFEITLDENFTPISRKIATVDESLEDCEKPKHEEIVKNCSPHISFQHIHNVILQLESSRRPIPEEDIRCLKYCLTIVEQQEEGVLDNAIITVLGMIITVIFKSGMELNQFEITLNDHGNPICHQTKKPGQESSTDDRIRQKSRQFLQFGDIIEDCHPCISFEHIHKIVQRLKPLEEEQLLHDGDMKCLKYCYTLVNKYKKGVCIIGSSYI